MKLSDIKPNPDNPRTATKEDIEKLKNSIEDLPKMMKARPIVIKDGVIVGGNQRYNALMALGKTEIPDEWVFDAKDWTEKEIERFIVQDNVSSGAWDWDILANQYELEDLDAWGVELPEYLTEDKKEVEEDEAPEVSSEPPVSQLGVVYQLGRHRVMCGDSTDFGQVETLMNKEYASFCFTSPPYSDMRDYGGGDLSVDKIASFLTIDNCGFYAINLGLQRKDNAINRYWDTYIQIAEDRGLKLTAWNIWSKRGMGGSIANMSAMFPIEHEWIFVFGGNKENVNRTKKNKTAGLPTGISNRQKDGTTKRVKPKNVQEYGVMGSVYEGVYATGEKEHPAVYPIHLPVEYIRACTQKNDIVYDPFLGSGTNVVACEQTDRICYGIELDPKYVDVIRKRYAKFISPDNQLPENWEELTPEIAREKRGE